MGQTVYRKDYMPPDYRIRHIDLGFDIRDGETFVTSVLNVERNGDHTRPLQLNGENLELLGVELEGIALAPEGYAVDDKFLTVQPPDHESFTLKTRVRIHPEDNEKLTGLYKSGKSWCTQCEAEGFRSITYFLDRPDNMSTFTVRVEADKGSAPVLLSNGNLVEEGDTAEGRHFTVWHDPFPKPSYLFALVASDLAHLEDKFETMSGRTVTLRIYAEPQDLDKLHFAMDSLKRAMKWDEEVYGREYDLDLFNIVAVSDFNMGAMENKSLNIFNTSAVLAHKNTQSDSDFGWVEAVVAHEYFHNWTGNRVTCRDWFQLTLKEGLTVFRDEEFSSDMGSRAVKRISDVSGLRSGQFVEDSGPLAHPIRPEEYKEINNFYTNTVYRKGAEVIRMMHTLLGAETFRKATDMYFERHDGQAVTCEDFIRCMEDASGRDLTQFRRWYSQAGTPRIDASWSYDKDMRSFALTLKQTVPPTPGQPVKEPMHMPVDFALVGADGKVITPKLLELTQGEQTFVIDDVPPGCVPSLFRGFSAPVQLHAPYTDSQLRHLMVHDNDAFNQWDAGQQFVANKLVQQIDAYKPGKRVTVGADVVDAFRGILARRDMDKMLQTWMLTFPSAAEIYEKRRAKNPDALINPDTVRAVYDAFRTALATKLSQDFWDIYDANMPQEPYSFDQNGAGRRALKNSALYQTGRTQRMEAAYAAYRQFRSADNMTDRLAAFGVLLDMKVGKGLRDKAVHDFYERYKNEPLALDEWFSARVGAKSEDSLAMAQFLAKHPDFNASNPNRARALYGAFAGSRGFHAKDGSGYAFLADFIKQADAKNPQLSSSLIGIFRNYKRYDTPWQELMFDALKDIASMPKISGDLAEKLERFGALPVHAPSNAAPEAQP